MYIVGTVIFLWLLAKLDLWCFRKLRARLGPPFVKLKLTDLQKPNWPQLEETRHYWLYVIRCGRRKFYVGITKNLKRRREEEWSRGDRCPKWLKLHRPKGYVGVYPLRTRRKRTAERIETAFTKDLWKLYGQSNVRGGHYSSPKIFKKKSS